MNEVKVVKEEYLGRNIGGAQHFGGEVYVSDREGVNMMWIGPKNSQYGPPPTRAHVPDGMYALTRTEGYAPYDVDYWGHCVAR